MKKQFGGKWSLKYKKVSTVVDQKDSHKNNTVNIEIKIQEKIKNSIRKFYNQMRRDNNSSISNACRIRDM